MSKNQENAFEEAASTLAAVKKLVVDSDQLQNALRESRDAAGKNLSRQEEVVKQAVEALEEVGKRLDGIRSEVITLRSEAKATEGELRSAVQAAREELEDSVDSLRSRSQRWFWIQSALLIVLLAVSFYLALSG